MAKWLLLLSVFLLPSTRGFAVGREIAHCTRNAIARTREAAQFAILIRPGIDRNIRLGAIDQLKAARGWQRLAQACQYTAAEEGLTSYIFRAIGEIGDVRAVREMVKLRPYLEQAHVSGLLRATYDEVIDEPGRKFEGRPK